MGIIFLLVIVAFSCNRSDQQKKARFQSLPVEITGIEFSNDIHTDEHFNVITYPFIYNGGGVAIGDINNDELPDIYFTGNQVSSKLYLNKGDFTFKDITLSSGTSTSGWAGGVSMVDINHDGFLDIYVAVNGPGETPPDERKNLLYINNGDLTFTEKADKYGIADSGFSVHSAFFDFDLDGDLDLFIINNFPGSFARDMSTGVREEVNDGTSPSTDALYRNNGDGTFTDISKQAGILKEGYSLGLAITDVNQDGWPDVYVSNDIQTDDLLYVNRGDGTFEDKSADFFKHTSYAGMGTDAADFNNDGWTDILQVDMLPPNLEDQHLVMGSKSYEYFQELKEKGYQIQNSANTLQLSNGVDEKGNILFSEMAHLAGVESTEWSWTGLFGDYDNDGWKDILITNGYPKAINNYDYIINLNRTSMFGTDSTRAKATFEILENLNSLYVPNHVFKNKRNLCFEDVSEEWGFTDPSFSYGAAHGDLDKDGDLDLVINNLNEPAAILENRSQGEHYLSLKLKGDSLNTNGIGAKLTIHTNKEKQFAEFWPYRGYQSTMDQRVHFGLGKNDAVDSLKIIWPDGKYQILKEIKANQQLVLNYDEASFPALKNGRREIRDGNLFTSAEDELQLHFEHHENDFVDFDKESTLPQMLSRSGPAVAVGDVNNDQRDDIYIGGASGEPGILFVQQEDGSFKESGDQRTWMAEKQFEDVDAEFADVNGDGWLDLYVVSGGNEFSPASELLQDRLYINIGDGKFIKDEKRLPRMLTSSSGVTPGDFDGDGDVDFFVGGRHVPGQYPTTPNSYLLQNDDGIFRDVTQEVAPQLKQIGEVTDAIWVDTDGDGDLDLVITGFWMPVTFFENSGNRLDKISGFNNPDLYRGWWHSIEKEDFNGDGKIDFAVGNLGLNHVYSQSGTSEIHLFADDFDRNRQIDPIFAVNINDEYKPLHGFRTMANLLPRPTQRVQSFQRYADANLQQLISKDPESARIHHTANYFPSSVLLNQGENEFDVAALPMEAQISAVQSIDILDINDDGFSDLILLGNEFDTNPELPRMDAGNGVLLTGDGQGNFTPVPSFQSGLIAPGNVKSSAVINSREGQYLLVLPNNSGVQVFKILSGN
ncbi:VCBS repeat-containing protein [Rhodohalobacter sp. 614A]|uniref:VCBS repeat-containing protein n=1 Tax=Rhodohalobacter sp. 614A TaxID=2908649 RepID=UPI001F3D9199|nr:VCBS repeat-containing protein [Rhodohalobacter sp. 614A]